MCKLFEAWSPEIKAYCLKNGYSFEKAEKLAKCWHKDDWLGLSYHDPEKGKAGLLDDTPCPAVLLITKGEDGKLVFETTEFTDKYLRDVGESEPELKRKIG